MRAPELGEKAKCHAAHNVARLRPASAFENMLQETLMAAARAIRGHLPRTDRRDLWAPARTSSRVTP